MNAYTFLAIVFTTISVAELIWIICTLVSRNKRKVTRDVDIA